MECTEFRRDLDAYLEESLEEDRRLLFRRHLRECASCSEWARAVEPSLLFAMADSGPVDMARVEACAAAVTAQIRQQRLAQRLDRRRRPWLAAAAAAVIVLGGTAAWQLVSGGGDVQPAAPGRAQAVSNANSEPPTVEVEMSDAEVRVYQFADDDDSDTAVYFIVNPALEL